MEQPRNVNRENKESEDCFDAAVLHNFIDNAKALLYNHFNKNPTEEKSLEEQMDSPIPLDTICNTVLRLLMLKEYRFFC
jgi:hypothetical protein